MTAPKSSGVGIPPVTITIDPVALFEAILHCEAAIQGAINDARGAENSAHRAVREAERAMAQLRIYKDTLARATREARGDK